MSFGFEEPIAVIQTAIRRASYSSTPPLFFAATRNDGANKGVAWPARAGEVIGISSTDGDGRSSSFNPIDDKSYTIFYALGQAVEVACPPHFCKPKNKTRVSGTSFANPIAVGLAANLLGYVRLAAGDRKSVEGCAATLNRLRSKDGMKAVLKHRMSIEDNCGRAILLPWEFLKRGRPGLNCILDEVQETLKRSG